MVYPFRASIFEAALEIARYLHQTGTKDVTQARAHLRLGPVDIAKLNYDGALDIATNLGWDVFGRPLDRTIFYRETLRNLIVAIKPPWARQTLRGRGAVENSLSINEAQCFKSAGLLANNSEDAIRWWDELAATFRALDDAYLTEVGRIGERLSFNLENERLAPFGLEAQWIALQDNAAGFDVLSYMTDDADMAKLLIEVKSVVFPPVVFFVTRHEWDTAKENRKNYVVHLWITSRRLLRAISVDEMQQHIPTDNGLGQWQNVRVKVPLSADWIAVDPSGQ